MKVKLEFFKCMGIMLANLCHPYIILSTTVLGKSHIQTSALYVLKTLQYGTKLALKTRVKKASW